jgi:hypothetical protein
MLKRLPIPLLIAALGIIVLPPVLLSLGLTMTSATEVVTSRWPCMALNILVGIPAWCRSATAPGWLCRLCGGR